MKRSWPIKTPRQRRVAAAVLYLSIMFNVAAFAAALGAFGRMKGWW